MSSLSQLQSFINQTEVRVCITLPGQVQSTGLWRGLAGGEHYDWFSYALPRVEMTIVLIFAVIQACHYSLKHLGFSLLSSQLIAGLMLSPAILGKTAAEKLITDESIKGIGSLGLLGYLLFIFLSGVKMDPTMVTRVSRRAFYIGFLAVIPPAVFAITIISIFSDNYQDKSKSLRLIPGYIMSSFPVITCMLSELKILNSELGRIGQSSAIISDALSMLVFMVCNWSRQSFEDALHDLTVAVIFVVFVFLMLRPALKLVIRYTPEDKPVDQLYVTIIILLFLISISLPKWFNRFRFLGTYILGLGIPHGPPIGSTLIEKLESMVNQFLLPIFIATAGMRMEKLLIGFENNMIIVNAISIAVALLVKFGASLLPPLYNDMPLKDTFALAFIMSAKGVVETVGCSLFSDNRIIDEDMFGLMFYMVLFVATIVPALVNWLYDPSRKYAGYNKRNLMSLKPNADLPIVACIHVPDNVRELINLLDIACPSRESPMDVNVLHLVKLRGQATPMFISHQKKKSTSSKSAYNENIVVALTRFEGNNWGAVSVNTFTAISSPDFMQDDICTLALDKLASLIILPFHRRWGIDGSIESDDGVIRALNSRVLEKSPCSVGILIDRGNISKRPMLGPLSEREYHVATIFLGGPDDREALTFAKRMATNTKVRLTVLHLIAVEDREFEDWGKVLDNVVLRDVKTNGHINFIEKQVRDGTETTMALRSMTNEFNLLIVGRRCNLEASQTSGLNEWSEFPELGPLGDLLASTDYNGQCSSVLVVKQQQTS